MAEHAIPSEQLLVPVTLSTLALQTCDDADHLNEVLRAYTALEKLVEPADLQDCETLTHLAPNSAPCCACSTRP